MAACFASKPCAGLATAGEPEAAARNEPGGPIEVDISNLAPEQLLLTRWSGRPVWILRRSLEMLQQLNTPESLSRLADPASNRPAATLPPAYARNTHRSIKPEVFVGIALCPHAGCVPVARLKAGPRPGHPDNWPGGFACPCHFATFDLAGRVFKGKPTEENIEVPRHMYLNDTTIVIGKDAEGEA